MKAVIKLDVPEWQIGEEVQVFFPDSMCKKGICELQAENAPTDEPEITNDDLQAAMTESYHLGYELAETKFKRPQDKWIPVSERLPDLWEVVLVTDGYGNVLEYQRRPSNDYGEVPMKWSFLGRDIIAWQPLPEPYKEAENE